MSIVWTGKVPTLYGSFATPRNSSYFPVLARELLHLRVTGRLNAQRRRHLKGEANCEPIIKEVTPLSLKKLVMPFLIVAIGATLALIILIIELTVNYSCYCLKMPLQPEVDKDWNAAISLIEYKLKSWTANQNIANSKNKKYVLTKLNAILET